MHTVEESRGRRKEREREENNEEAAENRGVTAHAGLTGHTGGRTQGQGRQGAQQGQHTGHPSSLHWAADMAALLQLVAALAPLAAGPTGSARPLTLLTDPQARAPIAFATDADNFLCSRSFGGGASAYPLPCKPPVSEYTSPKASEFVITAWWPPTISSTEEHADIDQLQEYKAAHFNLVLTGNVVGVCQHFNATPTPATANEALHCVMGALERVDKAGLQATFTPGHYASFTDMASSTFGGIASFGGVTKRAQRTGSSLLSAPELGWIKRQLEARTSPTSSAPCSSTTTTLR